VSPRPPSRWRRWLVVVAVGAAAGVCARYVWDYSGPDARALMAGCAFFALLFLTGVLATQWAGGEP
jgi:peptidoglycan/LPS O-acetylase OafA/YrhL